MQLVPKVLTGCCQARACGSEVVDLVQEAVDDVESSSFLLRGRLRVDPSEYSISPVGFGHLCIGSVHFVWSRRSGRGVMNRRQEVVGGS